MKKLVLAVFLCVSMILGTTCNVFGASGSEIQTQGETGIKTCEEIQAEIDRLAELGGGTVKLSEGTFMISTLKLRSKVVLEGSGRNTVLKSIDNNPNDAVIQLYDVNTQQIGIRNLSIDGNKSKQTKNVNGILLNNSEGRFDWYIDSYHTLEDLLIYYCKGHAIYVPTLPNQRVIGTFFNKITIRNCDLYGMYFNGTDSYIQECQVAGCQRGFYINGGNNSIVNCKSYWNYDVGLYLDGSCTGVRVTNFESQEEYNCGVYIKDANGVVMTNIVTDSHGHVEYQNPYVDLLTNEGVGITLDGCQGCILSNVVVFTRKNLAGDLRYGFKFLNSVRNCHITANVMGIGEAATTKPIEFFYNNIPITNSVTINGVECEPENVAEYSHLNKDSDKNGVVDGYTIAVQGGITAKYGCDPIEKCQKVDITANTSDWNGVYLYRDLPTSPGEVFRIALEGKVDGNVVIKPSIAWFGATDNYLGRTEDKAYLNSKMYSYVVLESLSKGTAPAGAVKARIRLDVLPINPKNIGTAWLKNVIIQKPEDESNKDMHTVGIGALSGGSITASATAAAGDTVNLTVTPEAGKRLKAGRISYSDGKKEYAICGTSFTMPAADVTVTAEFETIPPTYTISTDSGITGGVITPIPGTAEQGVRVNLAITPDANMQMKEGSLKYNDGTQDYVIEKASFIMPAANVTVTGEFEAIPYTVSIGEITGGTITTSNTTAAALEVVTLTVTPNTGMQLKAGSLKYNDGTEDHAIEGTSFIMPADNVTVTAEFEAIPYTVSIGEITGGTITASNTTAAALEVVTLTVIPNTGMQLKAGTLKYNDGTQDYTIEGTSFTMPAANVTVTAEFVALPPDVYSVSIGEITGGTITVPNTTAAAFDLITLTVTPNVGMQLKAGSLKYNDGTEDHAIEGTSFLMPSASVTVTAEFEAVPPTICTVTFDKNGGDTEASPATKDVISGTNAGTLPNAPARSGYTFNGWNTEADGGGSPFTATTEVTGSITVYAQWTQNSGSPGNGDGGVYEGIGGTSIPAETPKTETKLSGNTATATTTTKATVDNSGNAAATVTNAQVSDAIGKAIEEAEKHGEDTKASIEIKVEAPADASAVETVIPKEAVCQASETGIGSLTISTPVASITFDKNTISALSGEAEGDVKISVSKVEISSLSPETQQTVGDRPVFDFSVSSGGNAISQFGGAVSVSVPYTPKEGEDINAIVIYYINDSGVLELVSNCIYDSATGRISFSTRHFSQYAVGYNKVNFKDVAADIWYSKPVTFIAARGITTGTGNSNFSPEAKLTRGQFIVMLMKAYGMAPDVNSTDNFSDAGNTYYSNYLAAAKRLGISAGVGNNLFAPEKEITRQEMFTLLYNVLKSIGKLPQGNSGKSLSSFSDEDDISLWARDAMKILVETGIVSGDGILLTPSNTTTRAEMAMTLYNLLRK